MARKNGNGQQPGGQPKMKKTDAVRQALAEGVENNNEIVEFARAKFGLELTPAQVSTYKSNEKKAGNGGGNGRKRGRRRANAQPLGSTSAHGRTATFSTSSHGLVAVDDLEAVRELVRRIGADSVKRMADLFV